MYSLATITKGAVDVRQRQSDWSEQALQAGEAEKSLAVCVCVVCGVYK